MEGNFRILDITWLLRLLLNFTESVLDDQTGSLSRIKVDSPIARNLLPFDTDSVWKCGHLDELVFDA